MAFARAPVRPPQVTLLSRSAGDGRYTWQVHTSGHSTDTHTHTHTHTRSASAPSRCPPRPPRVTRLEVVRHAHRHLSEAWPPHHRRSKRTGCPRATPWSTLPARTSWIRSSGGAMPTRRWCAHALVARTHAHARTLWSGDARAARSAPSVAVLSAPRQVWDSRIDTTRDLVSAIEQSDAPPSVFVSASGISWWVASLLPLARPRGTAHSRTPPVWSACLAVVPAVAVPPSYI